jgi:hypothetical protein
MPTQILQQNNFIVIIDTGSSAELLRHPSHDTTYNIVGNNLFLSRLNGKSLPRFPINSGIALSDIRDSQGDTIDTISDLNTYLSGILGDFNTAGGGSPVFSNYIPVTEAPEVAAFEEVGQGAIFYNTANQSAGIFVYTPDGVFGQFLE